MNVQCCLKIWGQVTFYLSPKFFNCIVWKFNCNDASTCWPAVSVCKNCPGTVLPPPPPPSKESKFWWEGCSKPWPGFFSSLNFLVKKLISHENYPALIIYIRNYKDKQMKTYLCQLRISLNLFLLTTFDWTLIGRVITAWCRAGSGWRSVLSHNPKKEIFNL